MLFICSFSLFSGTFQYSIFQGILKLFIGEIIMLSMSIYKGPPMSFHNSTNPIFNLLYKIQMSIWAFKGNLDFLNLTNRVHLQPRNSKGQQQWGIISSTYHQGKKNSDQSNKLTGQALISKYMLYAGASHLPDFSELMLSHQKTHISILLPRSSWPRPLRLVFSLVPSLVTHVSGEPGNNQHSSALSSLHGWIIKEINGEL